MLVKHPALPLLASHEVIVVGIDPGLNGGLAAVHGGHLLGVIPTPLVEIDGREWVDSQTVYQWLALLWESRPVGVEWMHAMVERAGPHRGDDSRGVFRFGSAYGAVLGAVHSAAHQVHFVHPAQWQACLLPTVKGRSHLKRASCEFAARHYPAAKLVQPRCRVPHDGMADALCIAHYGHAVLTGTIGELENRQPQPARAFRAVGRK